MMVIEYAEGAPYWVDVSTPDLAATTEFYRDVFGWDALDLGDETGHYTLLSLGEEQVAAAGPLPEGDDTRPSWTTYFKVTDTHAVAKAVEAYGGNVVMAPMDVFDQTTIAYFTDPIGAPFAASTPRKHQGADRWAQPGAACWVELMVRQTEPALGFYRQVFGWHADENAMPDQEYTTLRAAAADEDFGGIFVMSNEIPSEAPPHWVVYFEVVDCEKTCERLVKAGGQLYMPPKTYKGVGTFAYVTDQFGADFYVITSM